MRPHLPLVVGACAAGLLPACTQAPEAPERPNVLFILLDDLAYDAIGSSGRYPFLETPNISRLQREGVTFSNFFCTMSLSSPSRACFLTGVYPHLHGVTQNDVRVDPLWDVYTPYPQLLQERGYETAFIGKMHNAELWGKEQIRPGFDYWLGFRGQGDYFNPVLNDNGREFRAEGYITDLLTDYACRWLTEERDRSKPFAMCLWHKAVHMPFKAAPRHEGCYADQTLPLPPNGNGVEDYTGKPACRSTRSPSTASGSTIPNGIPTSSSRSTSWRRCGPWTNRSARSTRRLSGRGNSTTRSSSSPATTATSWANTATGTNASPTRSRCASR